MKRFKHLFPVLLLSLLLCCCKKPVELPVHTVSYQAFGTIAATQAVNEGAYPDVPELSWDGVLMEGWQDARGLPVDPALIPITADTVYTAVCLPDLSAHVPYLFPDETGSFRPNAPLTGEDVASALESLAAGRGRELLPQCPAGELTSARLEALLSTCFPKDAVSAALGGYERLTRQDFARIMNGLLGRGAGETLTPKAPIPGTLAVTLDAPADFLEAVLPHASGTATWDTLIDEAAPEEGFFLLDGWLYYMNANGSLLKNGDINTLHFGPDGRYTSGDEAVDAMVAALLKDFSQADPTAGRLDLLRDAYDYCRDQFLYLRGDILEFGQTGWELEHAKSMLSSGKGNCYDYAAAFWALSRGLGYEAQCLSGYILDYWQPHGWVEITIDGVLYAFDPEEEMASRVKRLVFTEDMFMMTYDGSEYRQYVCP